MRRLCIAAALVLASCGGASCGPAGVRLEHQAPATWQLESGGHEDAVVTRVVDGDTIEVRITGRVEGPGAGQAEVGRTYDVRLIGIDTPETVHPAKPVECFGREASSATEALLEGQTIRLVDDVENSDGYDRLLRYVYLRDEMANARLVVNGYASAYTYPPNVRHTEFFVELQRDARGAGRGLWADATCP
jgi:micrococcal nuclease